MSTPKATYSIAAVVATRGRARLLAERSLPSIAAQTRRPDVVIVVDDSEPHERTETRDVVTSLAIPHCEVVYLTNQRTRGASGAWNTGLMYLLEQVDKPEQLFVAILDDDDAWAPSYLARCLSLAADGELDMVAAGLRRFETGAAEPLVSFSPETLVIGDFLTGNPGIQGSNLFMRLAVFMAAGCFDEALRSCTDRDLCIRVCDLGSVRYGRITEGLVDHYADSDRPRLSSPSSSAKLEGLSGFWSKYLGRMSPEHVAAFQDRARRLFGWTPPNSSPVLAQELSSPRRKAALVLGVALRENRAERLLEILQTLGAWRDGSLVGLDVVLLGDEQSARGGLLEQATRALRDFGVGCYPVTPALARSLVAADTRADTKDAVQTDRPIGAAQSLLADFCAALATSRVGSEVWLAGTLPAGAPPSDNGRFEGLLAWLGAVRSDRQYAPSPASAELVRSWLHDERIATAEHRVRTRFTLGHLRLLGLGSEAVVFTDGALVYKCVDYWKTRMPASQLRFLQDQVGRWPRVAGLYSLHQVVVDGHWALITYEYESSVDYRGGHDDELIRLLEGARSVGIVCNNIHPKNLVVTESGVKLIDYGSDIRPWSVLGFEHMARRAYLASRYAEHPELGLLMRRSLHDSDLPELAGYPEFRAQISHGHGESTQHVRVDAKSGSAGPRARQTQATRAEALVVHVGVITSDPFTLAPLLSSLITLAGSSVIRHLTVTVLDNGSPAKELRGVVTRARQGGLNVAVVTETRQREDAARGAFGQLFGARPPGKVGIARARTMLQRYVGALVEEDHGSFAWILDDDMRVDARAVAYLPWLPSFRAQKTDVLLGAYDGSSPNPPLNALRTQLMDLLHNLHWLNGLRESAELPDRRTENEALRRRFPDYYYDLSRKHTAHLEMPMWLEPAFAGETVHEARRRLIANARDLLLGVPTTRPLVADVPLNPLTAARASVNRGGCTFILNPRALSRTPNLIIETRGSEARRSDMVWAILNRDYHRMNVLAVSFPVHHDARRSGRPELNIPKVQAEIMGSTLYAGLTEFLRAHADHDLSFTEAECREVQRRANQHLQTRLGALRQSLLRVSGLRASLTAVVTSGELDGLFEQLDTCLAPGALEDIRAGLHSHEREATSRFLLGLRSAADEYARGSVDGGLLRAQWSSGTTTSRAEEVGHDR